MQERGHSKLGASKAARWLACPGSVALCATLPEPDAGKRAREGSAAHYVAEQCLRGGQDADDFIGRKLAGFAEIEVTPEMTEAVQVYVELCRSAIKPGIQNWIEHPFALLDFDADLYGHNDFAAFDPKTGKLVVVDYKHGAGVAVSPEQNKQLMYYGLGALMQIPKGVKSVRLVIVQPRAAGDPVKHWECTPYDLLEYGAELAEGAEKTRLPNAPLSTGSHCQFCPAKVNAACPALRAAAEAVVLDEFADMADVPKIVAETDPETVAELLEKAPVIKMWLGAIEKHALAEALKGRAPDGWKLVHKGTKRQWRDGELAMRQALKEIEGLELSDLFEQVPLSPAQFEKRVGKAEAAPILSDYLEKPKPGYALAPLSDKRQPVSPPSESDFADIAGIETDE